ncbi:hypothetical protein SELMODRAFT_411037 [Selaginella moellendorffii]|uniref:Uncharacterized protein n=1 Tax=Selaginella moellendorffii TaxID=88036 RepID=D8RGE0_SELML|nr:hypothetical protein SELMODRAFT_411037 [Selaginella moellendorffii]
MASLPKNRMRSEDIFQAVLSAAGLLLKDSRPVDRIYPFVWAESKYKYSILDVFGFVLVKQVEWTSFHTEAWILVDLSEAAEFVQGVLRISIGNLVLTWKEENLQEATRLRKLSIAACRVFQSARVEAERVAAHNIVWILRAIETKRSRGRFRSSAKTKAVPFSIDLRRQALEVKRKLRVSPL